MLSCVEFVILMVVVITLGLILAYVGRQDIQKTKCPYCTCRDGCNIGFGIDAACPEEELEPLACKKK